MISSSGGHQDDLTACPVVPAQALAAAAELAIPHFVSASIFAVTGTASPERFQHNLRMLMVRVHPPVPFFCAHAGSHCYNHCPSVNAFVAARSSDVLALFLSNGAYCCYQKALQ